MLGILKEIAYVSEGAIPLAVAVPICEENVKSSFKGSY
jgi:hypothetical protein